MTAACAAGPSPAAGEGTAALSYIPLASASPAANAPSSSAMPASAASTAPAGATPTRASVAPTGARLVRAFVARGADAAGNPIGETDTFSRATDQRIVLLVQLAGATTQTTVGYRRYFENAFVDGKNTHPLRDGDGVITVAWVKSGGALYPAGAYRVSVLIDGRVAGQVVFTVR